MTYSFDSVRATVRNKSRDTRIKPDLLYRWYFIERLVARIADSEHVEESNLL